MNIRTAHATPFAGSPLRIAALGLVLGLVSVSALSQGVYRIVGPDGRVSYSDQPPPAANARPVASGAPGAAGGANAQLPFELRQVVSRFPVVLYTSPECAPCNSGRNLLNARGIPYSEKTITTFEDAEALKRLSGVIRIFIRMEAHRVTGHDVGNLPLPPMYVEMFRDLLQAEPVETTNARDDSALLTAKEQEVLTLLCNGLSNNEISNRIGVALSTTKWHLKNIYSKLNLSSRTEAILSQHPRG